MRIWSVKANSQAGNIYESMSWQHKKAKAARYSAWGLQNLRILPENLAGGLGSSRERW